jgi:hypothetical protein
MDTSAAAAMTTTSTTSRALASTSEVIICEEKAKVPEVLVLRLKSDSKPKVSWIEGTIDNEYLCKKSSKSKE